MAFTWFDKFTEAVSVMPDDKADELIVAIVRYGSDGSEPDFTDGMLAAMFLLCKDDIDNSKAVRESGKKGGKAKSKKGASDFSGSTLDKKCQSTLSENSESPLSHNSSSPLPEELGRGLDEKTQANTNQSKPVQASTGQGGGARAKAARFTPPTPEEVDEYTRNRGTPIDGARFCDFYASKGWRVGSSPMKDWKAAARNWAGRDRKDAAPIVGAPAAGEGGWMPDAG